MTSTLRIINLLGSLCLFVHLVVALPAPPAPPPLPRMSPEEQGIYRRLAYAYPELYNPVNYNPPIIDYYRHLSQSYPQLEQEALAYAHGLGNGPYAVEQGSQAGYAMTIIQGDKGPAIAWNLRQVGCQHYDCTFFWRIEPRRVRLLRMDLLPAHIRADQQKSMLEAIRSARLQLSTRDPLSFHPLAKRSQRSTSKIDT